MRLQFMDARKNNSVIKYLQKVKHFIEYSRRGDIKFANPESFEQHLAEKVYNWKICKLPVEVYPVTAVRMSYINRSACFVHQELKLLGGTTPPCVPKSEMDFAIMNLCPLVNTRNEFAPFQSFAFVKNEYFQMPPEQFQLLNKRSRDFEVNVLNTR